jgi:hypothetical protein
MAKGLACESILAQAGILLDSNSCCNNEVAERGSIAGSHGCEMEKIYGCEKGGTAHESNDPQKWGLLINLYVQKGCRGAGCRGGES